MVIATGQKKANNNSRFLAQPPLPMQPPGVLTWVGGKMITNDVNARGYINNGYLGNDTIYSIISQSARKFASIPVYVYKVKDKKALKRYKAVIQGDLNIPGAYEKAMDLRKKALEEADESNPIAKLLKHPNENEGQSTFLEKAFIYRSACGGTPIYVNRGGMENGIPLEMENLPAQYLQIQGDGTLFGISRYVILTTNISLDKSQVIYWKYANPDFHPSGFHLYGLSPLRAAAMTMQANNDSLRAMVAMFQNGGARGLLYQDGGNEELTTTEVARLQEVTDYKINNNAAKSKVVITPVKLGYVNIGLDAVDMDLLKAMGMTSDKLCNVYSFPPGLLNPSATYDNRNADMKYYITNKIVPEWNAFRDELNNQLIPMYNGRMDDYFIDYDISDLPEMQEDFTKLSVSLQNADWLTDNEKRERTRYEPIDKPEYNTAWKNNTKVPIAEAFEGVGGPINQTEEQLTEDKSHPYKD